MVEAGFQFGILTPEQVFLCHVTLPLCDKGRDGYFCYYCFRILHSEELGDLGDENLQHNSYN